MAAHEEVFWGMPGEATPKDLLVRVKKLELIARKNAYNYLKGNYITRIKGKGLDFHEARKYVYGESIRQIDWNITARMLEPYVREFNEEREREIFIVLDASPSMHTGWQRLRKIEHAVEIAASLAYSVTSAGDRLGYATYTDKVLDFLPPAKGRARLFAALKTFIERGVREPEPCDESDMRQAVHTIQKLRGKRFIIFFISDFIDNDIPDDLKYLQAKHDVYLFHVYDPFEYDRIKDISFLASAAEGRFSPCAAGPGMTSGFDEIARGLDKTAGSYNIRYKPLSTKLPVGQNLLELFHFIKRRAIR